MGQKPKITFMLFDKIINSIFSFGAALVVFGAWAKLEHKEFGNKALTIGMLVETGIFCIYGFLEWRNKSPQQNRNETANSEGVDLGDLTDTMKETNQILNKVFKTQR
jgi:hypothetical protein